MKKFATILLLSLLVFNWIGYRLLTDFMEQQSSIQLEANLDKEIYNESELIEIRVPMNMPYITDQPDFERIDGEITLGDVHYKYVKRKIEKGQLVLLCIPNESKMEIQSARDRFFAMVNDLEHNGSSKDTKAPNTKSFKSLFTEYWSQQAIEFVEPATALLPKHECLEISYCLSSSLFPPAQPPDALSLS